MAWTWVGYTAPSTAARSVTLHSQQSLVHLYSTSRQKMAGVGSKSSASTFAVVHSQHKFVSIQQYLPGFILFDHSTIWWSIYVCVCVQENSKAMLHCLRLELSDDGKKIVEIPRLLYWINHNSSFSSPSLIDYFIATRLSTCHHICIQPPENYAAPFPSLTLISDCGFLSLRLQLKKINAGIIYLWVSRAHKTEAGSMFCSEIKRIKSKTS